MGCLVNVVGSDVVGVLEEVVSRYRDQDVDSLKETVYRIDEVRDVGLNEVIVIIPPVICDREVLGVVYKFVRVDPRDFDYWCAVLPFGFVPVPSNVDPEVYVTRVLSRQLEIEKSLRGFAEKMRQKYSKRTLEAFLSYTPSPEEVDELAGEGSSEEYELRT